MASHRHRTHSATSFLSSRRIMISTRQPSVLLSTQHWVWYDLLASSIASFVFGRSGMLGIALGLQVDRAWSSVVIQE